MLLFLAVVVLSGATLSRLPVNSAKIPLVRARPRVSGVSHLFYSTVTQKNVGNDDDVGLFIFFK